MARRNWADGQEITFEDLNKATPNLEKELYDWVLYYMMQQQSDAFFGSSLQVSYVGPTAVNIAPGIGFIYDATQVKPEPLRRLIKVESITPQTLTAADGSNDRIDIVCVKWKREDITSESRKHKDLSDTITTQSFDTENDWTAEFLIVDGTPAGSPVAPATPAGYLKLCECYMNTGVGLSGAGDITDSRTLLPFGSDMLVNTTALSRVTQAAAIKLGTTLLEMDALLNTGEVPLSWYQGSEPAPTHSVEYETEVQIFSQVDRDNQKLYAHVTVPKGYVPGTQIKLNVAQYSPSAANTQLLLCETYHIRANQDPVDSPAANRTSTNSALTNTVAKQLRRASIDLTDSEGKVGANEVNPGDTLILELYRSSTDTDTDDVRFVPGATSLEVF